MRRILLLGLLPLAMSLEACSSDDSGGGAEDAAPDGVTDARPDTAADAPSDVIDATALDVDAADAAVTDGMPDRGEPDAVAPDAADASVPDAADADVPDTTLPDVDVPDNNAPDTNVPDTNVPDTNVPDTNVPDAADAAPVDAGAPVLALPASGVCTRPHWCWQWPKPFYNSVSGIWGASDTDVWAVGGSDASLVAQTTLAHWDGVAWRGLIVPKSEGAILSLSGVASNDIWGLTAKTGFFHYDGVSWTNVPSGTGFTLRALWAVSPSLAYAVGDSGTLRVWNGSAWTSMASGTTDSLIGVWASSATDVWTLATTGVWHWDGAVWTSMPAPTTQSKPQAIWGAGPSEVYLLTGPSPGILYKANGASWTEVGRTSDFVANAVCRLYGNGPSDVFAVTSGYTATYNGATYTPHDPPPAQQPRQIWGTSGSDIFYAGNALSTSAPLFHWNGATWTSVMSDTAARTAHDAAFLSASDIWLAEGKMTHFDGTKYTSVTPGTSQAMYAVEAISPTDVWAGGTGGVVAHLVGSMWTAEASAGPQVIGGLRIFASDDVWALGLQGAVYHRDATGWSDLTPGGENDTIVIGGVSSSDVWVAGASLHHWTGASWTQTALPQGFARGAAVHAYASNDVYLLDRSGQLAHYNGATWSKLPTTGSGVTLKTRVLWLSPTDIWAGSDNGFGMDVVHFDGAQWTPMFSGFELTTPLGIFGSAGDVWALGADGSQSRYQP